MGRHLTVATASTQSVHPWRATIRTAVQVGVPTFIAFAALVPELVQLLLDQFGAVLPDSARAGLLFVAALITGAAALITRIMALPRAVQFARQYMPWLAPDNQQPDRVIAG